MSLQSRLNKLEAAHAMTNNGECPHGFDVRYYGSDYDDGHEAAKADRAPNKVCDVCQRKKTRINVVYVDAKERSNDELRTQN